MAYLTVESLKEFKVGFDFSNYTDPELETLLEVGEQLIEDYIGYKLDVSNVVDEEGIATIQYNGQLYIDLKGRNITTVSALNINVSESQSIAIDIDNIELHRKAGFFYLDGSYNINHLTQKTSIPYKVSYTQNTTIPKTVPLALSKIVGNLLRADINSQSGATGEDGKMKSFISGDYAVKFSGSSINYKGVGNSGAPENDFIDDSVKILLYKLRRTGQNTY